MTESADRLEELAREGDRRRERLAETVYGVAEEVRRRRVAFKVAGMAVTGVVAAGTAAWKLFGRSSPAARIGRATSGASILLGLGKAFFRLRRFL